MNLRTDKSFNYLKLINFKSLKKNDLLVGEIGDCVPSVLDDESMTGSTGEDLIGGDVMDAIIDDVVGGLILLLLLPLDRSFRLNFALLFWNHTFQYSKQITNNY
jgi:hypothetical protein